ncbi:ead/Ea22-like family protein [Klebsiella oxytoca]|nr:ead/Ea22-like family protein [Klebsiella oxytoca]ELM5684486.1 ead/Ea22-like family protein [Klebsiella oxytoca]MDZ7500338.1 ead/Ea22-like family protein [Klebsiella oxytoca]HEJ8580133.1 ead/Ea22-like family protein [Klebsiella oxytoca]
MTTDITDLAQSLKAAAEKASGGDWVKESGDGWDATCSNDDQANSGFIIAHFVGPDSEANREFVQLANPANILALVEALEKAQQRIDELENDEVRQRLANAEHQLYMAELAKNNLRASRKAQFRKRKAAEQRIAELESRTVTVENLQESAYRAGLTAGWNLGLANNNDGFNKCLAAHTAGIKVEAE